ncbi:MAG: PAS domain-containing protein, partial [Verrucomicrobia bacterium]|nr:PAS domain-containing protein [Verrucomicrobiota bacterium]
IVVEISAKMLDDGRIQAFVRDITERKKIEEALLESENRLRLVMDATEAGVWDWNITTGEVFFSRNWKESLGYSGNEIAHNISSWEKIVHPDDMPKLRVHLQKHFDDETEHYEFENRLLMKNGDYRWNLDKGKVVERDADGKPLRMVGTDTDITQRKEAENKLNKSERRGRTLLEDSPVCNKIIDLDSRLLYMSSAGVNRLKIPDINSFYGCTYPPDFFPESTRASLIEHLEQAKAGEISSVECLALDMEGCEVWYHTTFVPARDDEDRIEYIIATSVDITERKHAEEKIKTALREKEVMLKEIHHRVKNNLQVISSLLNLQSRYIEDDKMLALFMESRNRVQSMALIHEKLYQAKDFSQIDFSDYARDLSRQLFRANNVNPEKVRFKAEIEEISLSIDVAVPCGLIINELLTNALKHAFPGDRKGTVMLQLHSKRPAKRKPKQGGAVVLTVSDDGVGLPDGFNIESTTSLGVQLVKTLSAQIDGVLQIKSGKGTHFAITFENRSSERLEVSVV